MSSSQFFRTLPADCVRVLCETGKVAELEIYGGRRHPSLPLTSSDVEDIHANLCACMEEHKVLLDRAPLEQRDGMLISTRKANAFSGTIVITSISPIEAVDRLGSPIMRIEISGKMLIDALRACSTSHVQGLPKR